MNINRILRTLTSKQADKDSKALPKGRIVREESLNESLAEYHSQGYGIHFCLHDKSYYEPCTQCKRTRREALANLSRL